MSSIQEDYGDESLNKIFRELKEKDKNDLSKLNKEHQINTLKRMKDPRLQIVYDDLPQNAKDYVDGLKISQKYMTLERGLQLDYFRKLVNKNASVPIDDFNTKQMHINMYREIHGDSKYMDETDLPDSLEIHKRRIGSEVKETEETEVELPKGGPPPVALNNLVKYFYDKEMYYKEIYGPAYELEVRFGTKYIKDVKPLTKNDYDNVVKVLKSFGFTSTNQLGTPSLRIKSEMLDKSTGRFKMSDVRVEINGMSSIEKYCKSNNLKQIYKEEPNSVKFNRKHPYFDKGQPIKPIDFDDFNFRVALSIEQELKKSEEYDLLETWNRTKKEFRYLNRVSFTNDFYPVSVDLSITKTGNKAKDQRGNSYIIPTSTIEESNVFINQESYEIEIEVLGTPIAVSVRDNKLISSNLSHYVTQQGMTKIPNFKTPEALLDSLRKVIKMVLTGLQGTAYPVSYVEQREIINDYMRLIWADEHDINKRITSQYFIGPNSVTLQLPNIAPLNDNSTLPNIRKNFLVTEKADGDRHLMYISKVGKIYLISTNMDVKFTGAKTKNEDYYNTLMDGELISHDKNGKFINLYAAFDIYYIKGRDVRQNVFLYKTLDDKKIKEADLPRHTLLDKCVKLLRPTSILSNGSDNKVKNMLLNKDEINISPIDIKMKEFYPIYTNDDESIFQGCRFILEKEEQGLFPYETDGLIFTHMLYGVGSNEIGKAGPKTKITWENSFKWKPPQFNTIDFLVTTVKNANGNDLKNTLVEDGISASASVQFSEYKTIELRCGFNERYDGYINPCQDIIDDNLPEFKRFEERQAADYVPMRFYPTEPYDPNAGICNIMLKLDDSGVGQMFTEEGDVFVDNTIVEFSYDLDREEGWRWVPLRVRYDKTGKLRRGEREYGNSYKVCNENWKSIHPTGRITEDMLITGEGIPNISVSEDVYYNTPAGKMKTDALKKFHNLYVKKLLITGVTKPGDTLIDFACGKAGDLPKWIASKLSFVFGVDYSSDNLENHLDGACARYLSAKKNNKNMPGALFVNGNSSFNIKDGTAMLNDKAKRITAAVFGNGPKEADKIGKGVSKQYGKGDGGFNVSSCQFAMHYFFETPDSLKGFLRNVAECTKVNGYFIGTCYDGQVVFNKLAKTKKGESIQLSSDGKRIWEIIKNYDSKVFEANSSSIGYEISVYQESINQYISEYLVNFDYFDRLMDAYGFKVISNEEAKSMGLPSGSGLFSELFVNMLEEIKRNHSKKDDYGQAPNMTSYEKEISFLNRFFIYKKMREVNLDKLYLELGEYDESVIEREMESSKKAVVIAKEELVKPKVRKLSKKLMLVQATEAVDEPVAKVEELIEKQKQKKKGPSTKKALKNEKVIIESDDEM